MKSCFICSLCHKGVPGKELIVDDKTITFRTKKASVERKYRNLVLNRDDIRSVS